MDVEEQPITNATPNQDSQNMKDQKRKKIIITTAVVVSVVLVIFVIILILALTVFKAKDPKMTVNSVSLDSLSVSTDKLKVLLNVTLGVNLVIKNPNKVGFTYSNSTSYLNYRGQNVGQAPIPGGKISSDGTENVNFKLSIMADRLATNMSTYQDVLNGVLPLNMVSDVKGKVKIMNLFKISVESASSCDFNIFIQNSTISRSNV
ncbi:hypothetical protein ACFE04_003213 [Oxalis oulophora]